MPLLWMDNNGDRWDTHHGLVVSGPHTRCVRVMSDIYSDEQYAQVWNPEHARVDEVHVGGAFELNTRHAKVVVDAPPEVFAFISAQQAETTRKAEETRKAEARKAEEDRAKREVLAPTKGRTVVVVGGRKVKKGTKGTVFWTDSPTNPARVGIKDANDTTHWVAARWCETVYADFPVGGAPACGWVVYRDALRAQEEGYKATLPKVKKGDMVTLASTGLTGKVFWTKDTRLGLHFGDEKDAAGNYLNKAWADLVDVCAVNGITVSVAVAPPTPAPPAAPEFIPHDEVGEALPWPYSAISALNIEDGVYAAYDAKGEFLLHLDNEGAEEVFRLLPHVTLQAAVGV
jgi:hypothetical protein